ncbi:DNA replication/repair protein RecF [Gulosibacter chungangensis]|uniref:DNA replication and repair protein RecF n=1 Tax=Gulosibacter chungangensis TaxID=979746 RepID=A0A7J5BG53_9MICO|nr:DNA replication/repair protein RecF [Gulosibacter chungangensis]KAB1645214.1 DNA replication/repair protein RecF [Gulosibacter chungangensis]
MHVTHLTLQNFRNYASADLDLAPGVRIFEGVNGQGKTNLIEAIAYLSTLRSHRVSSDSALVKFGEDSAVVRAELAHGPRTLSIDVEIAKSGSNRARVSGHPVRARELPRYFNTVVFAPEDLALVRGEPAQRRAFIDSLLATHAPRLAEVITNYERVLKQRNSLLRSAKARKVSDAMLGTLEVWNDQLISLGTEIIAARLALVTRLRPHLAQSYRALVAADHGAGMTMRVSALADAKNLMDEDGAGGEIDTELTVDEIRQQFAQRLADARSREFERGTTLVGPHRDDVTFWLNDLPARITASQGESWSFALSLKLAAAQLVREESRTGDPVLILDDVFAELDGERRSRLAAAVESYEQVLITCAVLADLPKELWTRTIRISAGRILGTQEECDADESAE